MSGNSGHGDRAEQKSVSWRSILWSTGFSVTFFAVIITMFYLESTSPRPHFIQMVNTNNANKPKPRPSANNRSGNSAFSREALRNLTLEIRKVVGASEKQGLAYGLLKPKDHHVIPNIAHFIWFSCHPFKFEDLISVLSVHRVMKAEAIYFHTDCEPTGKWWLEAKEFIPTLKVVHRTPPAKVFDRKLDQKLSDRSVDVAKLQILTEGGGIYLNTSIYVVAPLEPLRYYDYVVGKADKNAFSNEIILANKDSKFLKLYYESFKRFRESCWECTVVKGHYDLAMRNRNILHIEPDSMAKPPSSRGRNLFVKKFDWQNNLFTIRNVLNQNKDSGDERELTAESIKTLDSPLGQICRYIYYGSTDLIKSAT
ncbi:uncharacterized protein [Ptychodera flava]|uniref:uncharacterized protein n=1 Tax=Ptychodera flava TaxID=63121 RepID=UPI00396A65BA